MIISFSVIEFSFYEHHFYHYCFHYWIPVLLLWLKYINNFNYINKNNFLHNIPTLLAALLIGTKVTLLRNSFKLVSTSQSLSVKFPWNYFSFKIVDLIINGWKISIHESYKYTICILGSWHVILTGSLYLWPWTVNLYQELGLKSLQNRRKLIRLSLFYKIYNDQSLLYLYNLIPAKNIG